MYVYTFVYDSNKIIHLVTVHCIISFQSLDECYLKNNWSIKVKILHLTANMVNSL